MKVRTKLGVGIALPLMLLGAMLANQVRLSRNAVMTLYELTAIWSRVNRSSVEQLSRVTRLEENAAKYLVTRDRGYLDQLEELSVLFEGEMRYLQALPLEGGAREEVVGLGEAWDAFAAVRSQLADSSGSGDPGRRSGLEAELTQAAAELQRHTERVSQASLEVMAGRLVESRNAAQEAERASITAALAALLLGSLVALLVIRSIAKPIRRVMKGAVEIGLGRLDHRIDDLRDDEFAGIATEFNRMAERLGELDRMKRDFVSHVSHDLKTPLAVMQETGELLLDNVVGPLTEKQRHVLRLHQESGGRLSRMLGQLLELSRLEAEPSPPAMRPVSVAELIPRVAEHADARDVRSGKRVTLQLPDTPILLTCDPDGIRRLLDNVMDNARKFSPPHGRVCLDVQTLPSRPRWIPASRWAEAHARGPSATVLLISVLDEGPGIPDAEKELVFSRFHQGERQAGTGHGVGLGLTICREIVLGHGGTIWVADNPGGGSIVRVLLPGARVLGAPDSRAAAIPAASMVT